MRAFPVGGRRKELIKLLSDPNVTTIVVEHRDRLTRFGFEYIEASLRAQGRRILVVEEREVDDDLVRDVTEVLTSLAARLYGKRSARRRAKRRWRRFSVKIHRAYRYELDPNTEQRILHATVRGEADRWFVSLTVEEEIPDPPPPRGPAAGIDAGLKSFTTLADETGAIRKTDAPRPLRHALKRLRRLQRKLSRRGVRDEHGKLKTRTKNYEKTRLEIARLHRRIRNIRLDFLHKLTTELVRTHPVIAIEDLNVAGMLKNDHLARHIADVGWGTFRALLEAKAKLRGVRIVKAGRFEPTSKTCSPCGHVLPELPLSVRAWTCPVCGAHHDRDENALSADHPITLIS
ncbi:MAG: Mobile element protein [Brockia lithotrophica]|uniref:Mobile element protein n=1 Tax=Brockia lithotrophica TaxID=933949 RepID=A0A2T5G5N7_9BACL|nr:IS200/IS605 family element transposase accessory protein TnpB [Brockia lithotrophica]PTQ51499.1 MAG: Mobile element protein [Brockia lithotrophica]